MKVFVLLLSVLTTRSAFASSHTHDLSMLAGRWYAHGCSVRLDHGSWEASPDLRDLLNRREARGFFMDVAVVGNKVVLQNVAEDVAASEFDAIDEGARVSSSRDHSDDVAVSIGRSRKSMESKSVVGGVILSGKEIDGTGAPLGLGNLTTHWQQSLLLNSAGSLEFKSFSNSMDVACTFDRN